MKNAMIEKKINDTEEKILDEYDLINSLSIGNYCRKIKHKFNTEELAVLVYRNKRMSIDEKISIYKNLIKNYPDMEVIKRINCKHYDSVRELISDEIKRLQDIKEYEDIIAYNVSKKYLNCDKPIITAEFQVINNKRILNNIYDSKNNFLDIDNIYIKIPTPFKKGDILATWDYMPSRKRIRSPK